MQRYGVVIEKTTDGYGAYVPDLPGCVAVGDTYEETDRLNPGGDSGSFGGSDEERRSHSGRDDAVGVCGSGSAGLVAAPDSCRSDTHFLNPAVQLWTTVSGSEVTGCSRGTATRNSWPLANTS